jgi:signal transduction histidine kinase
VPAPRLPAWRRAGARYPWLLDIGVAAAVALVSLPAMVRTDEDRPWVWALDVALVVPLIWRRKAPVAVFAVLAVVGLVQWAAGVHLGADVALLVALYTIAAYRPRRMALAAGAVLGVGAVLAATRFAPAGDDVVASLIFLSGLVVAAFFIGTSVQNRRAYLAALVERANWLERERDAEARLAAVAERASIARELHDTVAHSLTVVITLAEAASATVPADPAAAQGAMGQVATTGRDALTEMRRLLGVLRADETGAPADAADRAPAPGLDRIDELIGSARAAGLPVRLTVSGRPRRLPSTMDITAYRTVQESLTNALRHAAEPTKVQVELRWSDARLAIDVTDDGRPAGRRAPGGGHGLTGMRERLAVFGGSLSTGPGTNGGWHVAAVLPLPEGLS